MKKFNIIIALFTLSFFMGSCAKDFLETSPTDKVSSDVMFESMEGANLALNGMYRYLYTFHAGEQWGAYGNHDTFGHAAHLLEMDLMGEDMVVHSAGYGWFNATHRWLTHRNALAGMTAERWRMLYAVVNNANIILYYIQDVDATDSEKAPIIAQAHAARAIGYYHLVLMYAKAYTDDPSAPGIPIYLEPGQEGNPRSSVSEVYAQITSDLEQAITLFDGSNAQAHKSHINLAVAHGYLARTALVMGDWTAASNHASMAIQYHGANKLFKQADYPAQFEYTYDDDGEINGFVFTDMPGFNDAAMSSEWMWGSVINEEHATIYASFMSHMDPRFMTYASLGGQKKMSPALYDQIPESDVRRNLYMIPGVPGETGNAAHGGYAGGGADIPPYTQLKFLVQEIGSWQADYMYMRLAEMFMIKAEAQARAGQDAEAAQTLFDLISTRDSEYTLSTNTGDALIDEIMLHRRIELWGEGHRWIDLKRLGLPLNRVGMGHDPGMAGVMEVPAGDPSWQWLIPQDEVDANDAISEADQNPL